MPKTEALNRFIQDPAGSMLLKGPVGSGKSEYLLKRAVHLIETGVSPSSIWILCPSREVVLRYRDQPVFRESKAHSRITTFYGIALDAVNTFWPAIFESKGFANKGRPPRFLTYETAQYVLLRFVRPHYDRGDFRGLVLRPQQIASQLLDNMNKAAINRYPLDQALERLTLAWNGEAERLDLYRLASGIVNQYREYLLERNLLDISLTLDCFGTDILGEEEFIDRYTSKCQHLLVDNFEESVPLSTDFVQQTIGTSFSSRVVFDTNAGYRRFMGIDQLGAISVAEGLDKTIELDVPEPQEWQTVTFGKQLSASLGFGEAIIDREASTAVKGFVFERYRTEMIASVVAKISDLLKQGIRPDEIALVAPYVDGVLEFNLARRLDDAEVPFSIIRRYEKLKNDLFVRASLSIAQLVNPSWQVVLDFYSLREALGVFIPGIDTVRAELLARIALDSKSKILNSIDEFTAAQIDRIGSANVEAYENLREWIDEVKSRNLDSLEEFMRTLFGDQLNRHPERERMGNKIRTVIDSARKFSDVAAYMEIDKKELGKAYIEMIYEGVVASPNPEIDRNIQSANLLLFAPVYSFLLTDKVVKYQFWLDVGSMGWWEPIHQSLTNSHVLSRAWKVGEKWTDDKDIENRNNTLHRLITGLCRRCSDGIYLCASQEDSSESGDNRLMQLLQENLKESGWVK